MDINNLIIEVTRVCNLKCAHCLRGKAEKMHVNLEYVETIFKTTNYVSSLILTGGEPALYPEKINSIIALAEKHKVIIGSFYMATNGTISSNEFINSLISLYLYCDDNDISCVDISNDMYHDIDKMNINRERLQCLSFVRNKFDKDYYNYYAGKKSSLIGEGNAENLDYVRTNTIDELEIDEHTIEEVYLNCEGNIIKGCDWSYDSQRDEEMIYCHVDKLYEQFYRHTNGLSTD